MRVGICIAVLVSALLACTRGEGTRSAALQGGATSGEAHPDRLGVVFAPQAPSETESLRGVVSGAGEKVSCQWTVNGTRVDGEGGLLLPAGSFRKGDRIEVRVTSGKKVAEGSVVIGNSPPRIVALPFTPGRFHRGIDLTVHPQAADPDGDPVQFRFNWLLNGQEIASGDSQVLSGERFHRGDRIALCVIPYDHGSEGTVFRSAEIVVPNAPPRFVSPPPGPFQSLQFNYLAQAEDADGDSLTYALEQGPKGMHVDPASGAVQWQITPEGYGKNDVVIAARDPEGASASLRFTLDIGVRE